LSLLFLTDWVAYLPRSVLAAMVIVPVFSLLDFSAFRRVLAMSRTDGAIVAVTFFVTLFSTPRLHWGVVAGVGLTMASFLYRRTLPRIVEVGLHGDGTLRDRARFGLPPLAPDLLAVRMDAALIFLTATALERFINERCQQNPRIKRVLLCASGINEIDVTGLDTLQLLKSNLLQEGIDMYACAIKKQVWDMLEAAQLVEILGRGRIFSTDAEAITALSSPETQVHAAHA
jgi:sulfate permease, SulP family